MTVINQFCQFFSFPQVPAWHWKPSLWISKVFIYIFKISIPKNNKPSQNSISEHDCPSCHALAKETGHKQQTELSTHNVAAMGDACYFMCMANQSPRAFLQLIDLWSVNGTIIISSQISPTLCCIYSTYVEVEYSFIVRMLCPVSSVQTSPCTSAPCQLSLPQFQKTVPDISVCW